MITRPNAVPSSPGTHRRLAIILSGGGARGAYEVGVLSYVFDELSRLRGAPPRIDVLSGTSVGAINACHLAAHLDDPRAGMRKLVELWTKVELPSVLGFGLRQAISLPRVLLGGGASGKGIFDVRALAEIVQREVPWPQIQASLKSGALRVLSVSTTDVNTGRTVVFMQLAPEAGLPSVAPPRTVIRAARIGPSHALASAAIPIVFPPVEISGGLYVDGGLRQNTPIAPAIRLGATHVFAIGLSRDAHGLDGAEHQAEARAPGAAFLLGKVLNAFLLDHVQADLELLGRVNAMLTDGVRVYGPSFLEKVSVASVARGGVPYRPVHCLEVRPSEDIGRIAAEHVRKGKLRGGPIVTKQMLNLLDVGYGTEADLASYLLFDGDFARRLIDLGRADAAARREELLQFFGSPREDDGPSSGNPNAPDDWSYPPPRVG